MGNLTEQEKGDVIEQLVDVTTLNTIRVRTTEKTVEVPVYVEKEIEVPVFKTVEIGRPVFTPITIEVPKIVYNEVDITKAVRTLLEGEIRTAVHAIVTNMKFSIKFVPNGSGMSVELEALDGK